MIEMKSIKWQLMRHSHLPSGLKTVKAAGEVQQTGLDALVEQGSLNGISYLRVDEDGLRLVDGFTESQRRGSSLSLHVYDVDGWPPSPRDMLEISDRLGAKLPGQLVESRRREVADQLFEDADFGDWTVAATNGWEGDGVGRYARQVFLEHDNLKGPSRMIRFAVEFEEGLSSPVGEPEFELPHDPTSAGPNF
ncbi:hypothetical protein KUV57_13805 [Epibacterium sp. DP7N7-1]|nr:hypothetical protein [Epibacterium sp. DP7N7-1]